MEVIEKSKTEENLTWDGLRTEITRRRSNLSNIEISVVKDAFGEVDNLKEVSTSLRLDGYNLEHIDAWVEKFNSLVKAVKSSKDA